MNNSLAEIFTNWCNTGTTVVQLLNKDHIPVAAIYLDKLNIDSIIICDSNSNEKYYLYLNGIGIFFSYYKKCLK